MNHLTEDEDRHVIANPDCFPARRVEESSEHQAERRASMRELQRHGARLVDEVVHGTTVVITNNGEPRARLVPLDDGEKA
jgi:prevent-host-death family protein